MTARDKPAQERLLLRLQEQRRAIEGVARIGPEQMSAERFMHHVAAQVARVTNIERTKVMRYRPDRGDLLVEAGVGWKPGVVGHATLDVDYRSPAGHAVQTASPVTIRNIQTSEEFRCPDLLREHDVISVVNVPVMINGETWGVLEADSSTPIEFDAWDVSFLTLVADIMGVCLALHQASQKNLQHVAEAARHRAQSTAAIREMQHRMKNNLQIIIAFVATKLRYEQSPDVQEKLRNIIGRIQAVALAHDLLSVGKDNTSVRFDEYLRSLCGNIDPGESRIAISVNAEPCVIPIDRAVPAGLIVNELITNAIKYAFGTGSGSIKVHFGLTTHSSEACVSVEDDGKGMPIPPRKGLGLSLVDGFAQQIQGRIDYVDVKTGTRTVLCFPVPGATP